MGLFDNGAFKLTEQALDATWYKQKVISHNIANISTPDYKARTVNFGIVLRRECECRYHVGSSDHSEGTAPYHNGRIDGEPKAKIAVTTTYETNTNQLLNGNNVDIEKEAMALSDAQYQYSALIDYMNSQYSMIRSAINK